MSTPPPTSVRLPLDLRAEIRERARVERRSFSNQVIVLLEAADGEPILASARAARARAIDTREELRASRERSRAAFREAMKARERVQNSAREKERKQKPS